MWKKYFFNNEVQLYIYINYESVILVERQKLDKWIYMEYLEIEL